MINAHIIIIGDELLDGTIADMHVQIMSKWLKELGVHLKNVTFARDHESTLLTTIKNVWTSSHITILTGGLGPTKDDITKQIIGNLFNLPLKKNDLAEKIVQEHYQRFDKEWSKETSGYHLIPEGVQPLSNSCGLAPGLSYQSDQKILLAAPGVPRELYAMMEEEFSPLIKKKFIKELKKNYSFVIRTHSIAEEKIFFDLEPKLWEKLKSYGRVSSLPQSSGVDIRVTLNERPDPGALVELKSLFEKSSIIKNIWQWGDLSLPEYLLKKAREKKLTISCAESCTGGLASSMLTDVAGCSDVFMGSAVTYSYPSKTKILGVSEEMLKQHGAVSEAVVTQMIKGSLDAYDSDLAISFSGIAGPGGATKEKPVGTVAIAVGTKDNIQSGLYYFKGNRTLLKHRFAMKGLFNLLNFINHETFK